MKIVSNDELTALADWATFCNVGFTLYKINYYYYLLLAIHGREMLAPLNINYVYIPQSVKMIHYLIQILLTESVYLISGCDVMPRNRAECPRTLADSGHLTECIQRCFGVQVMFGQLYSTVLAPGDAYTAWSKWDHPCNCHRGLYINITVYCKVIRLDKIR